MHRGERYTIFSDDASLDLATLDRHLAAAIPVFEKTLGASLNDEEPSLPAIHFGKEKEYRKFCKAIGLEKHAVGGYGCYAPGLPSRPIIVHGRFFNTLRHEASHQFLERAMGTGARDLTWVVEGLGALFEAYPPEKFTEFRRYRKGRERILRRDFSLEAFVKSKERTDGVYEIGATIQGILLFGSDRKAFLRWLGDITARKCRPEDLPRYLGRDWAAIESTIRRFCRQ